MEMNLFPYCLEIGVAVLVCAMVVCDTFLAVEDKGAVWGVGSMGLLGLLLFSFTLDPQVGARPGDTWVLDAFAIYFKQFFLLSALFALLAARTFAPRFRHGEAELYSLTLFATMGGMCLASALDWVTLFVALELMTITLFVMVSWSRRDRKSLEAGMKYVVMATFSSAFLLLGISFLYGFTGTTRLGYLSAYLGHHGAAFAHHLGVTLLPPGAAESLPQGAVLGVVFGILLVTTGLLFKMAAFPLHVWAPDVYEGAPTPVTGFLGVASKGAGFVLAMRLGISIYGGVPLEVTAGGKTASLMAVLAGLTMVYGSLAAIPQWNIKRLMGYSSISHAGYLMMGLAVSRELAAEGSTLAVTAVLYYFAAYLFTTWGLFLVLCCIDRYGADYEVTGLAGLGRRNPLLGVTLTFAMLSLAGIPPMGGFFGKLLLLMAAFEAGYYGLAVTGMAMAVASMYVYLNVVKQVYAVEPADRTPVEVGGWAAVGCYVACAGMVLVGVFQGPVLTAAEGAAKALL